ncbi:4'-phosphopantetheinyl transferase family protein, partial [Niallia taxi]|uniref:4'-phosphopantetheinyl transferase family protein n=1 Tax=Niallia taxi TaxID=2499688 RepID=UPI00300818F7
MLNINTIHKRHYSMLDTCLAENKYRIHNSSNCQRKQTIFSGDILLRYALLKESKDIANVSICYNEYGKPSIKNENIHFNLSHSKNSIVLGIAKQELGIDILCERRINKEFIRFFFSKEEQIYLDDLTKEKRDYYWNALCFKEAYIKRIGGKIIDMKNKLVCPRNIEYGKVIKNIEENEDNQSIFFKELNYHICLIANQIYDKINIENLN